MSAKSLLLEYADPKGFWGSRIGNIMLKVYDIAKSFAPQTIVELGRGNALYTVALMAVCDEMNGKLDSYDMAGGPPEKRHQFEQEGIIDRCKFYVGNDFIMTCYPVDLVFIDTLHEDGYGIASDIASIVQATNIRLKKWKSFTKVLIIHGGDYASDIKNAISIFATDAGFSLTHYPVGYGLTVLTHP